MTRRTNLAANLDIKLMKKRELLRIAQVAHIWNRIPPDTYGGGERRIHPLTEELVKQGHDVTLYATGDSVTSARLKSVYPRALTVAMNDDEAYIYDHYLYRHVAQALADSGEFDLIHFHLGCSILPLSVFSEAKVLHTIPTCITVDDVWTLDQHPEVAVNGISVQQLAPVPESRRRNIPVIYNGCDVDTYRLANGTPEHLVFLGRMVDYKGPLEAIHIARAAKRPIVLAGEPLTREDQAYFDLNIKPLIDENNVIYMGPVNDQQKSELFSKAIALVFPIDWEEPFGYVMIEAMACGIPVIALDRGSVAEVVDFGITGYYSSALDELSGFVDDATNLDRQVIRERTRERFSCQRMVEDYLDLYESLLEPGLQQ